MTDGSPSRKLLGAALGVFDVMSPRVLAQLRAGQDRGARVTVSPTALRELLAAIDAVSPGMVETYVEMHREAGRS